MRHTRLLRERLKWKPNLVTQRRQVIPFGMSAMFVVPTLGQRRDPNLSRTYVDEHHEVDVDKSLHRPFLFARKIALPKCVGVAFNELVPGVRMIARRRLKACGHDHVLHSLPRNVNAHRARFLQDFRVTKPSLLRDSDDRVPHIFLNLRSARDVLSSTSSLNQG